MQNKRGRQLDSRVRISKTDEASRAYNIWRTAIVAANGEFGRVTEKGRDRETGMRGWRRRNIDVYFRLRVNATGVADAPRAGAC